MTTDCSGPEEAVSSIEKTSRAASAFADAEAVQLHKVIPLKHPAKAARQDLPSSSAEIEYGKETGPRSISGVRGTAHMRVMEMLRSMCGMKNVPIPFEHHAAVADHIVDSLPFNQLYQLSGFEEGGVVAAVRAVNTHLDVMVMAHVILSIAQAEGTDDVHDPIVTATANRIFDLVEATLPNNPCIRWSDPGELVAAHYAARNAEVPDG